MPGVVSKLHRKRKLFLFRLACLAAEALLLDYEEDVRKYAEGLDQAKILSVYRHVPTSYAKENKKFQYSTISKSARAMELSGLHRMAAGCGRK
jgi:hypothetical protein